MKRIDSFTEWAKEQPIHIAMFSHQLAYFADLIHEILDGVKFIEEDILSDDYPELDTWLNFYKTHHNIIDYFFFLFNAPYESLSGSRVFRYGKSQNFLHFLKTAETTFLNQCDPNILEDPEDKSWNDCLDKKLSCPDMIFVALVLLPCLLFYGKNPAQLLREARTGDYDSLEKLIRLDSSTIFEPRISKIIHNLKKQNIRIYQRLIDAIPKTPRAKTSRQRIKVLLAAQISYLSGSIKHKLTEPEVRRLFDLVAQEAGFGEIDTDLPESPEAFAKAIQREVSFWKTSFYPDKK